MIYKYTLYCKPGRLFRPGRHYLKIGEWVTDSSYIILCHGIMSQEEFRQFQRMDHVPVYQCVSYSWIGLYNFHESKKYNETQFAGWLSRTENYYEWSGCLHVG